MSHLKKTQFWAFHCERCKHAWIPMGIVALVSSHPDIPEVEKPRVCPKCKSPYWDKPRRNTSSDP